MSNTHEEKLKTNRTAIAAYAWDKQAMLQICNELSGSLEKMLILQQKWENTGPDQIEHTLRNNTQIWITLTEKSLHGAQLDQSELLGFKVHNLSTYIIKTSLSIIADPQKDKLDLLININREMINCLMSEQKGRWELSVNT